MMHAKQDAEMYQQALSATKQGIELWRNIKAYEGIYQVSNLGRVRSLPRTVKSVRKNGTEIIRHYRGKVISQKTTRQGYRLVTLHKHGIRKFRMVHRLLAQAFIPNPHHYPQINHKDEIRSHNILTNLEWCTAEYNNTYGHHIINASVAHSSPVVAYIGKRPRLFSSTLEVAQWLVAISRSKQDVANCRKYVYRQAINHGSVYGIPVKFLYHSQPVSHIVNIIDRHQKYQFPSETNAAKWLLKHKHLDKTLKQLVSDIGTACHKTHLYYHRVAGDVVYFDDQPAKTGKIHYNVIIRRIKLYNQREVHIFPSEITAARWLKRHLDIHSDPNTIAGNMSTALHHPNKFRYVFDTYRICFVRIRKMHRAQLTPAHYQHDRTEQLKLF